MLRTPLIKLSVSVLCLHPLLNDLHALPPFICIPPPTCFSIIFHAFGLSAAFKPNQKQLELCSELYGLQWDNERDCDCSDIE